MTAPNDADVIPDNGSRDPRLRCTWNERRLDAIERYSHETRGALSAVSSGLSDVRAQVEQLETRWTLEFARVATATEDNSRTLKLIAHELKVGTLHPTEPEPDLIVIPHAGSPRQPLTSLDYEEMSDTAMRRTTERLEAENAILYARNAALEATLTERTRQSERARANEDAAVARADAIDSRRWTRAQKFGAGILALIAAGGGGAGLVELMRVLAQVLGD